MWALSLFVSPFQASLLWQLKASADDLSPQQPLRQKPEHRKHLIRRLVIALRYIHLTKYSRLHPVLPGIIIMLRC